MAHWADRGVVEVRMYKTDEDHHLLKLYLS